MDKKKWHELPKGPFGRYLMLPGTDYPHVTIFIDSKDFNGERVSLTIEAFHFSKGKESPRFFYRETERPGVFMSEYLQPEQELVNTEVQSIMERFSLPLKIVSGSLSRSDNDLNWRQGDDSTCVDQQEASRELEVRIIDIEELGQLLIDKLESKPKLKLRRRENFIKKVRNFKGNWQELVRFIVYDLRETTDLPSIADFYKSFGEPSKLSEEELIKLVNSQKPWTYSSNLSREALSEAQEDVYAMKVFIEYMYKEYRPKYFLSSRVPKLFQTDQAYEDKYSRLAKTHELVSANMRRTMDEVINDTETETDKKAAFSLDYVEQTTRALLGLRDKLIDLVLDKVGDEWRDLGDDDGTDMEGKVMSMPYPYRPISRPLTDQEIAKMRSGK
ncbi:hypothetical protein AUTU_08710 [Aureibacter tunicatorum]|nr:hypothetical protein AUTU_08710 [Aureibacter tunicatorum]